VDGQRAVEERSGSGRNRWCERTCGICAEAQSGMPEQAATCRRGSSGRTMKPSRSAAAPSAGAIAGAKPTTSKCAPRRRADAVGAGSFRHFDEVNAGGCVGMAEGETQPGGNASIAQPMEPTGSAGGRTGGAGASVRQIDRRAQRVCPSLRIMSRACLLGRAPR
jgi:hypothetical protein